MGTHSIDNNTHTMKLVFLLALVVVGAVAIESTLEEMPEEQVFLQEEMKEQPAAPFIPTMLAHGFSLNQSPYWSMFFNPYSFIGYHNVQMEMMPHHIAVQQALTGVGDDQPPMAGAAFGHAANWG